MKQFSVRLIFIFSLFIITTLTVSAQHNLQGKWYMFSRSSVVELTISKGSIISKQLNWDLAERSPGTPPGVVIIDSTIEANGNNYFLVHMAEDSLRRPFVNTFRTIKPNTELIMVLNSIEGFAPAQPQLKIYIENDSGRKYGLNVYSEKKIRMLQKQKDPIGMTTADLSLYANKIVATRSGIDSLMKLPNQPQGLLYYGYSLLRIAIGEIGYNPLITTSDFNNLMNRLKDDPETKDIFKQLF